MSGVKRKTLRSYQPNIPTEENRSKIWIWKSHPSVEAFYQVVKKALRPSISAPEVWRKLLIWQFCDPDLFGMVSSRDPKSMATKNRDLQTFWGQNGHELNHLVQHKSLPVISRGPISPLIGVKEPQLPTNWMDSTSYPFSIPWGFPKPTIRETPGSHKAKRKKPQPYNPWDWICMVYLPTWKQ